MRSALLFVAAMLAVLPLAAEPKAPHFPVATATRPEVKPRTAKDEAVAPLATTLYSIGNPSPEATLYLELINRARANPAAEGVRLATTTDPDVLSAYNFFGVDLTLMQSEFAVIAAAPPLAFNLDLNEAADGHTLDMFNNQFQGHSGTGGSTISSRITAAGYNWSSIGENVFSFADSVWAGHAGFQVDWGPGGAGGMQAGRGHRANIHSTGFREIGIGVIIGTNGTVGPELVTQDLGRQQSGGNAPFLTGVVYYDLDGDAFYDTDEGVGGVRVDAAGAAFHAETTASGAFTVPLPNTNATRAVTFSQLGVSGGQDVTVVSLGNVKADLRMAYAGPVPAGTATPAVGQGNSYTFATVPGATAYTWTYAAFAAAAARPVESLAEVTATTTGTYAVLQSAVRDNTNGSTQAFHLAHPTSADQILELAGTFSLKAGSVLTFRSRLGWATSAQVARVQTSEDNGATWDATSFAQAGTGGSGEASFSTRTVDLSALAGKQVRLRFVYVATGSRFFDTDAGIGWYVDNISFTNVDEVTGTPVSTEVAGPSFSFVPPALGQYQLKVEPKISGRDFPAGGLLTVTAQAAAPSALATWRETHFPGVGNSGAAADTADPNGNGLPNFADYAFGQSPAQPGARGRLPSSANAAHAGQTYATVTFFRQKNLDSRVDVRVRQSTSLAGGWADLDLPAQTVATVDQGDGTEAVTVRATVPLTGAGAAAVVFLQTYVVFTP